MHSVTIPVRAAFHIWIFNNLIFNIQSKIIIWSNKAKRNTTYTIVNIFRKAQFQTDATKYFTVTLFCKMMFVVTGLWHKGPL